MMETRINDKGKYFTPRVNKQPIASLVRTNHHLVIGKVHIRPDERLKDELNNSRERFLAVTEARVYDTAGEKVLFESELLFVAYEHVVLITPIEVIRNPANLDWLTVEEDA